MGTAVRISLTLPSGSTIELVGTIKRFVKEGELDGRGPGIDISLQSLPQSVMWLIESALSSAGITPRPVPDPKETLSPPPPPSADERPEESPALSDGDEWVQAEGDLVKALWQELNSMSKMNEFQLLDLEYGASDQEVRAAFGALSKRYHPDRFTRYESFEIRELANEVFILLRDAYRKLANEQGRRDALTAIEAKKEGSGAQQRVATPPPPPTKPRRTPPPPIPQAAQGEARRTPPPTPTRAQGDVRKTPPPPIPTPPPPAEAPAAAPAPAPKVTHSYASPASTPVANLASNRAPTSPGEGANRVMMGMNVLESGQYEQALRILRVEARKDPTNVTALAGVELAEGRLALVNGDRMEAAERFEAALDIDPSNERAAREIADMRRHATSQRRGLLSKLMKKV
jgi:tetratricopeptide (TPR) repeat protein